MEITRCAQGHYYDSEKYSACPYCTEREFWAEEPGDNEATQAFIENDVDSESLTVGFSEDFSDGNPDDRTVGYFETQTGLEPVVGWLVCTDGAEKGRDYRLHSGRNFVGRSYEMVVLLTDDLAISSDRHCSVIYDPMHNAYFIVPGGGTNTYVNDMVLKSPINLNDGDNICIGASTFVFIAFCTGARNWK
jgi:hypothetical protein